MREQKTGITSLMELIQKDPDLSEISSLTKKYIDNKPASYKLGDWDYCWEVYLYLTQNKSKLNKKTIYYRINTHPDFVKWKNENDAESLETIIRYLELAGLTSEEIKSYFDQVKKKKQNDFNQIKKKPGVSVILFARDLEELDRTGKLNRLNINKAQPFNNMFSDTAIETRKQRAELLHGQLSLNKLLQDNELTTDEIYLTVKEALRTYKKNLKHIQFEFLKKKKDLELYRYIKSVHETGVFITSAERDNVYWRFNNNQAFRAFADLGNLNDNGLLSNQLINTYGKRVRNFYLNFSASGKKQFGAYKALEINLCWLMVQKIRALQPVELLINDFSLESIHDNLNHPIAPVNKAIKNLLSLQDSLNNPDSEPQNESNTDPRKKALISKIKGHELKSITFAIKQLRTLGKELQSELLASTSPKSHGKMYEINKAVKGRLQTVYNSLLHHMDLQQGAISVEQDLISHNGTKSNTNNTAYEQVRGHSLYEGTRPDPNSQQEPSCSITVDMQNRKPNLNENTFFFGHDHGDVQQPKNALFSALWIQHSAFLVNARVGPHLLKDEPLTTPKVLKSIRIRYDSYRREAKRKSIEAKTVNNTGRYLGQTTQWWSRLKRNLLGRPLLTEAQVAALFSKEHPEHSVLSSNHPTPVHPSPNGGNEIFNPLLSNETNLLLIQEEPLQLTNSPRNKNNDEESDDNDDSDDRDDSDDNYDIDDNYDSDDEENSIKQKTNTLLSLLSNNNQKNSSALPDQACLKLLQEIQQEIQVALLSDHPERIQYLQAQALGLPDETSVLHPVRPRHKVGPKYSGDFISSFEQLLGKLFTYLDSVGERHPFSMVFFFSTLYMQFGFTGLYLVTSGSTATKLAYHLSQFISRLETLALKDSSKLGVYAKLLKQPINVNFEHYVTQIDQRVLETAHVGNAAESLSVCGFIPIGITHAIADFILSNVADSKDFDQDNLCNTVNRFAAKHLEGFTGSERALNIAYASFGFAVRSLLAMGLGVGAHAAAFSNIPIASHIGKAIKFFLDMDPKTILQPDWSTSLAINTTSLIYAKMALVHHLIERDFMKPNTELQTKDKTAAQGVAFLNTLQELTRYLCLTAASRNKAAAQVQGPPEIQPPPKWIKKLNTYLEKSEGLRNALSELDEDSRRQLEQMGVNLKPRPERRLSSSEAYIKRLKSSDLGQAIYQAWQAPGGSKLKNSDQKEITVNSTVELGILAKIVDLINQEENSRKEFVKKAAGNWWSLTYSIESKTLREFEMMYSCNPELEKIFNSHLPELNELGIKKVYNSRTFRLTVLVTSIVYNLAIVMPVTLAWLALSPLWYFVKSVLTWKWHHPFTFWNQLTAGKPAELPRFFSQLTAQIGSQHVIGSIFKSIKALLLGLIAGPVLLWKGEKAPNWTHDSLNICNTLLTGFVTIVYKAVASMVRAFITIGIFRLPELLIVGVIDYALSPLNLLLTPVYAALVGVAIVLSLVVAPLAWLADKIWHLASKNDTRRPYERWHNRVLSLATFCFTVTRKLFIKLSNFSLANLIVKGWRGKLLTTPSVSREALAPVRYLMIKARHLFRLGEEKLCDSLLYTHQQYVQSPSAQRADARPRGFDNTIRAACVIAAVVCLATGNLPLAAALVAAALYIPWARKRIYSPNRSRKYARRSKIDRNSLYNTVFVASSVAAAACLVTGNLPLAGIFMGLALLVKLAAWASQRNLDYKRIKAEQSSETGVSNDGTHTTNKPNGGTVISDSDGETLTSSSDEEAATEDEADITVTSNSDKEEETQHSTDRFPSKRRDTMTNPNNVTSKITPSYFKRNGNPLFKVNETKHNINNITPNNKRRGQSLLGGNSTSLGNNHSPPLTIEL